MEAHPNLPENAENINNVELALDERMNITRPRNPDKDIKDMKHWALFENRIVHDASVLCALGLDNADNPHLVMVAFGDNGDRVLAAYPIRVGRRNEREVVEAVLAAVLRSVWTSKFRKAAPMAAATLAIITLEELGVLDSATRIAYKSSTGRVWVFEHSEFARLRERYARFFEPAMDLIERYVELGRMLMPAADLFDTVIALVTAYPQLIEQYEHLGTTVLLELASEDPDLALALPVASALKRDIEELLVKAVEAGEEITRKLREEREEEVVRMYKEGVPVDEIARRAGIAIGTVYIILQRHGIEPQRAKRRTRRARRLNEEEIHKIIEWYKSGVSIYEIAKRLGRSTSLVYYHLKKHGLV